MFSHAVRVGADIPDISLVSHGFSLHSFVVICPIDALFRKFAILVSTRATTSVSLQAALCCWFHNCCCIVVIPAGFCKQEQMFIRLCGTIFYTFRQTVDLVPDNVRTEIPTICTKGKRQHPWNSNHIFWFDTNAYNV